MSEPSIEDIEFEEVKPTEQTLKRWKVAMNPFATTYALIVKEIESKSTRRLKYLLKYGEDMTETNCWWAIYQVWPIVKPIIEIELRRREYAKRGS